MNESAPSSWHLAWCLIRESFASPRTTSVITWGRDGKLTVERRA